MFTVNLWHNERPNLPIKTFFGSSNDVLFSSQPNNAMSWFCKPEAVRWLFVRVDRVLNYMEFQTIDSKLK